MRGLFGVASKTDCVAGIPDSGIGHAIGYATESGIPYRRPFVKYTPTWPRSVMPQEQGVRDLVARMKLIPNQTLPDMIAAIGLPREKLCTFCWNAESLYEPPATE